MTLAAANAVRGALEQGGRPADESARGRDLEVTGVTLVGELEVL